MRLQATADPRFSVASSESDLIGFRYYAAEPSVPPRECEINRNPINHWVPNLHDRRNGMRQYVEVPEMIAVQGSTVQFCFSKTSGKDVLNGVRRTLLQVYHNRAEEEKAVDLREVM